MKKYITIIMLIVMCLVSVKTYAETSTENKDIVVEKETIINLDYGENATFSEVYYITYIKNVSDHTLWVEPTELTLYDKDNNVIKEDDMPYLVGSMYMEPGEVSVVSYCPMVYKKADEANKITVTAILGLEYKEPDRGYSDININNSKAEMIGSFDKEKFELKGSVTNKDTRSWQDAKIIIVMEDAQGNPLYAYIGYADEYIKPGNTEEFSYSFEKPSTEKRIKQYMLDNNTKIENVRMFCVYEITE